MRDYFRDTPIHNDFALKMLLHPTPGGIIPGGKVGSKMIRIPKQKNRKPKWSKNLNKGELKHLKEIGATTLSAFQRTLIFQREHKIDCFECRQIKNKIVPAKLITNL